LVGRVTLPAGSCAVAANNQQNQQIKTAPTQAARII
jgi:hypothetical protein